MSNETINEGDFNDDSILIDWKDIIALQRAYWNNSFTWSFQIPWICFTRIFFIYACHLKTYIPKKMYNSINNSDEIEDSIDTFEIFFSRNTLQEIQM